MHRKSKSIYIFARVSARYDLHRIIRTLVPRVDISVQSIRLTPDLLSQLDSSSSLYEISLGLLLDCADLQRFVQ